MKSRDETNIRQEIRFVFPRDSEINKLKQLQYKLWITQKLRYMIGY